MMPAYSAMLVPGTNAVFPFVALPFSLLLGHASVPHAFGHSLKVGRDCAERPVLYMVFWTHNLGVQDKAQKWEKLRECQQSNPRIQGIPTNWAQHSLYEGFKGKRVDDGGGKEQGPCTCAAQSSAKRCRVGKIPTTQNGAKEDCLRRAPRLTRQPTVTLEGHNVPSLCSSVTLWYSLLVILLYRSQM